MMLSMEWRKGYGLRVVLDRGLYIFTEHLQLQSIRSPTFHCHTHLSFVLFHCL